MDTSMESERVVIAAFTEADLRRLHALLVCYESPFRTSGEVVERSRDEREHALLRRRIAALMAAE